MYWEACRPSILLAIHNPVVTAGLMWPPGMFIVAETSTGMPTACARATMSEVTAPAFGPASAVVTTLPAPKKTNTSVPTNSAVRDRRFWDIAQGPRERVAAPILGAVYTRPNTSDVFVAPNPNEVDTSTSGAAAPPSPRGPSRAPAGM